MDSRDYHQPYSAHPAHPRIRAIRSQPYYDNERDLSLDSLSLSDDECTEDMFLWTKSSRNQGSRDSHRRGQKGEYQGTNRTFVVPRSQGPAIDIALRSLRHELSASLKIFQPLVQCFEADIEPLRDWAEDLTLDTVWKNKAKKFFREKRDRRRYEGMATRISRSRATVKDAIKDAKVFKETWDKHNLERQILTAKKAIVFCDGIVGLAERAASDRRACKQLVVELEEARSLLDRKKHPWIFGEEEGEQQAGDMEKLNGRTTEAKREQWNGDNGAGKERGGWFRPAGLFPGYSGVRSGDSWM